MFNPDMLREYSDRKISLNKFPTVVGLNKWKGTKSIYSEYFCFLHENFGFEKPIRIMHCVLFKHSNYLYAPLYKALVDRKNIKLQLDNDERLEPNERMILESFSTELKLKINACYGYTLCRENNLSSPYVVEVVKTKEAFNKQISREFQDNFLTYVRPFGSSHCLVANKRINKREFNSTPVIAVGSSILGNSKTIILENICFLLRFLDPRLSEALYFDTDSIFLALHHPNLDDNVVQDLQAEFRAKKDYFIHSNQRISGFLCLEKINNRAEFYGEKMYLLSNQSSTVVACKGVSKNTADKLKQDPKILYNNSEITVTYPGMKRTLDCPMVIENQSKKFKKCIVPAKRCFEKCHSLTF
jgi:hypothetical protein